MVAIRYSYFTKMIIFSLFLATLPVLLIGIFSYQKSSAEIQKQVNLAKLDLLKQMDANVEEVLNTVNHTLDQLDTSTTTKKVMDSDLTAYDFSMYNDLRYELSHMQSFGTHVNDVVLVNFKHDWLVKNSGLYRLDAYSQTEALKQQLQLPGDSSWELNPSKLFTGDANLEEPACAYTISLVKKLPADDPVKTGLAYANISACQLSAILDFKPASSERILILDNQGRILLGGDPSLIGKPVQAAKLINDPSKLTGNSGQFNVQVNGDPYTLSYYRSPYNGWVYISLIAIDSLTKESKKIGYFTFFLCLLIFLLAAVVAWLGSRRMYNPIRKLVNQVTERNPEYQGRRANEFELIGDQVQRLFASKSKLEHEVNQQVVQIRQSFFVKWLQGNVRSKELMERLKSFGFQNQQDNWRTMAVIALQIDSLEGTRYLKEDADLLLFAVNNIVEEITPPERRLAPVIHEQTQVLIVGSEEVDGQAFQPFLYGLTESIQKAVADYLDLSVSIGISLPFMDLRQVPLAFQEGIDALKQRINLGEGVIIHYNPSNSGKHYLHVHYPQQKERDLIDAIKLADAEQAEGHLNRFMEAVFSLELPPQEYQIPLVRLLNDLINLMQETGITLSQINKDNAPLYEELLELNTAQEVRDWFLHQIALPLTGIFSDRQESQYHSISEKMIAMILSQFDTDLTIERCAAALHYNANYLSSVFRKETNMSFSEYLAAHRFAMAKKWLTESDLTVKEISERLRYNNSQNFIRSFRKVEGMTPGQFRERYSRLSS